MYIYDVSIHTDRIDMTHRHTYRQDRQDRHTDTHTDRTDMT